ncbi:MAG: hypothetical protein RLZ33_924 [Bacteroidota bacterium]
MSLQFFNLEAGFAGELLQKCANFRMQLVIVGNVTPFSNDRFEEFIGERNKGNQVNFAKDTKEFMEACKVSYESMLNCNTR